jgi:hypothetical protein
MESLNLDIDPLKLEQEWQRHPSLYGFWAEKSVEAIDAYDRSKAALDVTKANLDVDIREHPAKYGASKTTNEVVNNLITVHPEYLEKLKESLVAKKQMNHAKAVLDSLEHRKRALTMLVDLWVRDYYSDSGSMSEDEKAAIRRGRRKPDA